MPSLENNTPNADQANVALPLLDRTLSTLITLQDSSAIDDALLVLDNALHGPQSSLASQKILESVPLVHFFQLLQQDMGDDTGSVIDRACNVIQVLLQDQPFSSLIQDPLLSTACLQALESASPRIHILGLSQVDKIAKEDSNVFASMLASPIFKATVQGIDSESISVAEQSKQTLWKVCKRQDHLRAVLDHEESFSLIQNLVNSRNSIVQMRMLETLVGLASQSLEASKALDSTGLMEPLRAGLASADILTRFNIIEILAEFGTTTPGSEYLDSSGILAQIANVVQEEAQQDSLGVTAILKLYGQLGASEHVDFVSLDMKYQILNQLERLLVGDDDFEPETFLKVESMAAIGLIGGNVQNVEWVTQSPCAETFVGVFGSLTRDLKVAWFHSLAQIFSCSPEPSPETEQLVARFYSQLERPDQSPFMARLLVSAKSRTPELAMAALSVLRSLVHFGFGVQKMGADRDAIMFLVERNSQDSHAEKVAKFEIIDTILQTSQNVQSATGTQVLTAEQASRLELIRRQGPFFLRATATVSIQDMAA